MKKESSRNLMKKGWTEEEIKKAEDIISSRVSNDKSKSLVFSHRILFWMVLFVIIIGNTLFSIVLIPILLALNNITTDILIVFLGFIVVILFNFLIWDIEEHITKKHRVFAVLIIPILSILNLYAIVRISNAVNEVFNISEVRGNPLIISAFYVVAFLLPYLWTLFVHNKIKRY